MTTSDLPATPPPGARPTTGVSLPGLADVDLARIDAAHLEFRRACYDLVNQGALRRGLLPERSFTAGEFASRHGLGAGERARHADLFLKALTRWGTLVEEEPHRFRRTAAAELAYIPDPYLLSEAIGQPTMTGYVDEANFARLAEELVAGDGCTAATFDRAHLPLWEQSLNAPYYAYARRRAVHALTHAGANRLLDLGCGLGHGLRELARALSGDGQAHLVGVEASADFATLAGELCAYDDRISVVGGDLDEPLPQLPDGGFDGAMLVGTYHFLTRPEQFWHTARRLIRPGGNLVLAHVLSRTGSFDQELMELRFALRRPPGRPTERHTMLTVADRYGFALADEFALGCYRTLSFTRRPDSHQPEPPEPAVRDLGNVHVTTITVGPLATNAYLLCCVATSEQLLIDAGDEPRRLLAAAGPGPMVSVVCTHGDWDHTQALTEVVAATGAPPRAHASDLNLLPHPLCVPPQAVEDDDKLAFGRSTVRVIHIGGHSPGSIVLALHPHDGPALLFTGDALFPGGVGTTWGDSGAFDHLLKQVRSRLFARYPDDTLVLPGHGPSTTLGAQRSHVARWQDRGW